MDSLLPFGDVGTVLGVVFFKCISMDSQALALNFYPCAGRCMHLCAPHVNACTWKQNYQCTASFPGYRAAHQALLIIFYGSPPLSEQLIFLSLPALFFVSCHLDCKLLFKPVNNLYVVNKEPE